MPIVIHLGDFLQLKPTNGIGLIEDLQARKDDGKGYIHEDISLEVGHACALFKSIEHVFELKGTKRFVPGDPIIEFLSCMRAGQQFRDEIWKAFSDTFATDAEGELDPRHADPKFRDGYGLGMYWETLARWISRRARRDALKLGVPLIFCQCYDECSTMTRDTAARFLNQFNIHHTGHMHGVLPIHIGMRVRLTQKINATLGLVQEQKATIVDVVLHPTDQERYRRVPAGDIFRPTFLPRGWWLQVDDFNQSPIWEELLPLVGSSNDELDDTPGPSMELWHQQQTEARARTAT